MVLHNYPLIINEEVRYGCSIQKVHRNRRARIGQVGECCFWELVGRVTYGDMKFLFNMYPR